MRCPSCVHDNRDAAKFCAECAAPVARQCGSCGAPWRPQAKFCDERGATEPVRVFELEGVSARRTRLEVGRARGLTRFVGRDAEMDVLEAALARARAGGMRVIEWRCVPHGKNVPLLLILQIFRDYYGITEQDSDQSAREKLTGHLLARDGGYREVLPVLFEFFGVPDRIATGNVEEFFA